MVRLVIVDNGPGIAPDILQKVFDPLFSTKSFGSGLGLPTAHQIVELHGGTIAIESAPSRGTRVEIVFPCAEAARSVAT
jgi:signal transduction histidine kinase